MDKTPVSGCAGLFVQDETKGDRRHPLGFFKNLKNLEECAVKLAESVRYLSAGAVEFL